MTVESIGARSPKRQRGRLRVAAIMETAVQVFREKGYDAATMTEIAERSETAIGSLYRFFPSKESLADALLLEYAKQVTSRLVELELQVANMTLENLADAFVSFMTALQSQRSFAIALVDARGGSDEKRTQFREALRSGIARIIRKAIPTLTPSRSYAKAILLLHVLKELPATLNEKPATRRLLLEEIRQLVGIFLKNSAKARP
jgi:AcrR family transcriptional regulator